MRLILQVIITSLACLSFNGYCADALQVLPTRVVLSSQSSTELTLINKGTEPGSYRILLRNIRADDNGAFSIAEDVKEGEKYANKFIRYSPRRVTVQPTTFQKVRVMVRKPRKLPAGEYRTHLVFQSLPTETVNTLDANNADKLAVAVQPIVELSIPVIIRHGVLEANLGIKNPKVEKDSVNLTIERSGNRSTYGDLEVLSNVNGGSGTRIGYIRGLSVYVPNKVRHVSVPLNIPKGVNIGKQKLVVRFTEDPTYGGNLQASATVTP